VDILFAYKLLFGLTALHSDDFFILSESTCTRGHPYKLFLLLTVTFNTRSHYVLCFTYSHGVAFIEA